MTAAMLLLIFGLLALRGALGPNATLSRQRTALAIGSVATLPLAFGPIVPIAHFIFETTGRPMLVVVQAYAVLLLVTLAWRLATRWQTKAISGIKVPCAGALICYMIWLGSAIWLSEYEQGSPTPDVWDAPMYIIDWVSAVVACVCLAIAAWRIPGSGPVFRFLAGVFLVLVTSLVFWTLV